jgi:chemotaxis response regulator CheB
MISVLVVDDDATVPEILRRLLDSPEDIDVVLEYRG